MIKKIGTVIITHLLDDTLHIEAQGQVAEGDNVIIGGHRVTVGKICCERSGNTLSVGSGDRFCLPVNFNPDLVSAGIPVWLINSQQGMIMSEAVVTEIFKDAEELGIALFEKLHLGQQVFVDNLGPFKITALCVSGDYSRKIVHPGEPAGLKLEGFDFIRHARRGAEIFVVSDGEDEDGQPAPIEETVEV